MNTDNDVRITFKIVGDNTPVVLDTNKGVVEISVNDKYLDNKTLRGLHIAETRDAHIIENFWRDNRQRLSNNSVESITIEIPHMEPIIYTDIVGVRYQDIIFARSESVFPKRLMLSINVYEEE